MPDRVEPAAGDASARLVKLLAEAKQLAKEYYALTGRPLGITGEVAEYEVARLLGVTLAPVRTEGYDATWVRGRKTEKLQIKGRCLAEGPKPGQRIGAIKRDKPWDVAILVLLDQDYEATAIWEADRQAVLAALDVPGSKARNERGALTVSKFKAIGRQIWR
ncbi:MAG TPA: hypothetical protein VG293_09890 [Solirubrobacteraceae bacterium]|nr:hypothetical protein [Solirubrobacteraceae bacterium]